MPGVRRRGSKRQDGVPHRGFLHIFPFISQLFLAFSGYLFAPLDLTAPPSFLSARFGCLSTPPDVSLLLSAVSVLVRVFLCFPWLFFWLLRLCLRLSLLSAFPAFREFCSARCPCPLTLTFNHYSFGPASSSVGRRNFGRSE